MHAPRFVLADMGEYERCLAQVQAAYRAMRDARAAPEREAARVEHDRAMQRAREVGARLARELDHAARSAA